MRNKRKNIYYIFSIFLFFGFFVQAENKIIDTNNLHNTGLTQEQIKQIKDTVDGGSVSVEPEITSPSLGAVISSKDILFKGVATPNVNITIYIKDIDHAESNTIVGKTKSDNFGVWSYSLSSELNPSNYTVMATANDPKLGTINSEIVKFSIISRAQDSNQIQVKNIPSNQDTERMLFVVIIIGMVCFTFLIAFIILMVVFYLKEKQKVTKINLDQINKQDLENILEEIKKQDNKNINEYEKNDE